VRRLPASAAAPRVVFLWPLMKLLPSAMLQTFCVSPLPMLDGGVVFAYGGMCFPFELELLRCLGVRETCGVSRFFIWGFFSLPRVR